MQGCAVLHKEEDIGRGGDRQQGHTASRPASPGGLVTPMLPATEVRSERELSGLDDEVRQEIVPSGGTSAAAMGSRPSQPSESHVLTAVDSNVDLCRLLGMVGGGAQRLTGVALDATAGGPSGPRVASNSPVASGTREPLQVLLGGLRDLLQRFAGSQVWPAQVAPWVGGQAEKSGNMGDPWGRRGVRWYVGLRCDTDYFCWRKSGGAFGSGQERRGQDSRCGKM